MMKCPKVISNCISLYIYLIMIHHWLRWKIISSFTVRYVSFVVLVCHHFNVTHFVPGTLSYYK